MYPQQLQGMARDGKGGQGKRGAWQTSAQRGSRHSAKAGSKDNLHTRFFELAINRPTWGGGGKAVEAVWGTNGRIERINGKRAGVAQSSALVIDCSVTVRPVHPWVPRHADDSILCPSWFFEHGDAISHGPVERKTSLDGYINLVRVADHQDDCISSQRSRGSPSQWAGN